ncbi:unnamed protein product [Rotaria magnacalcarata]|nr:unnamed protein product [Rotaria magnacalcarata]
MEDNNLLLNIFSEPLPTKSRSLGTKSVKRKLEVVEEKNNYVESTNKKKKNERAKLDLCQGREMKSPKRSSLFTNNPTIPQMEDVNVETANEEVFGTVTSMDTMPVHPHIVS